MINSVIDLLMGSSVKSASSRGRTLTVHFGTNDIRDLSDGQLPLDVVRCNRDSAGHVSHMPATERANTWDALKRSVRRVSKGSYAGFVEQWVEIRTPSERLP